MNHPHVTIATLCVAAALFASGAAVGQTPAPVTSAPTAAAAAPATPPALDIGDCPDIANGFEAGKSYACGCSASALPDVALGATPIYGTSIYSDESNLCMAAMHAGVLKPNTAARIVVQMVASPAVFRGTTQNGVKSQVSATATTAAFRVTPSN